MKRISDIGRELDRMVEGGRNVAEMAAFMAVEAQGNPTLLKVLGCYCERWEALLSLENLRQWPVEHADTLAAFFKNLPCDPLPGKMPCGKKELLLVAALQDSTIPKAIRACLWRCLVTDGYLLPRYLKGEWTVPTVLYDHYAVRRWICKTRQQGYKDLRCSNRFLFFKRNVMATFKTDSDKKALKAIEEDSLPDLFLPLDLSLKSLPVAYIHVALVKKAQNIIAYMVTNRDEFKLLLTPSQLLFYVCANWNDDEAIPIVSMLDNNNPGLVMNSLDAFGRNALWYIFYNRERFNSTTEVAQFAKTPLAKTLIELGCNPDHKNSIDLSYNDVTG